MDKTTRNIIITLAIIFGIVCLCVTAMLAIGATFFIRKADLTPNPTPVVSLPTPMPTVASQPGETTLDPDVAASMDLIQTQVISLRGLNPTTSVPRALLSPDELRQNVINDFLSEYTPEDAAKDASVLSMLGLLPPDFDLISFYTELYSEQIAGYYDDEIQAMYVVQGEAFTGAEKTTYAHEYTHVLQDQAYDFDGKLGYTEDACEDDSERCAAIQSLIEGDATVTELAWFQRYATPQDYKDILQFYNSYESPIFDAAPHYMKSDFMFPYEKGQIFVQHLMDQGGYAAVDAAYQNVPVSTEQILHPEKYLNDVPIPVELPDLTPDLGSGWEEYDRNVMGEWYTYLILAHGDQASQRLEDNEALPASAGWGGDTYLVYHQTDADQFAFVMRSTWDTEQDRLEFWKALIHHADLHWGDSSIDSLGNQVWQDDGVFASIIKQEDMVTWIIAPDQQIYQTIFNNLP